MSTKSEILTIVKANTTAFDSAMRQSSAEARAFTKNYQALRAETEKQGRAGELFDKQAAHPETVGKREQLYRQQQYLNQRQTQEGDRARKEESQKIRKSMEENAAYETRMRYVWRAGLMKQQQEKQQAARGQLGAGVRGGAQAALYAAGGMAPEFGGVAGAAAGAVGAIGSGPAMIASAAIAAGAGMFLLDQAAKRSIRSAKVNAESLNISADSFQKLNRASWETGRDVSTSVNALERLRQVAAGAVVGDPADVAKMRMLGYSRERLMGGYRMEKIVNRAEDFLAENRGGGFERAAFGRAGPMVVPALLRHRELRGEGEELSPLAAQEGGKPLLPERLWQRFSQRQAETSANEAINSMVLKLGGGPLSGPVKQADVKNLSKEEQAIWNEVTEGGKNTAILEDDEALSGRVTRAMNRRAAHPVDEAAVAIQQMKEESYGRTQHPYEVYAKEVQGIAGFAKGEGESDEQLWQTKNRALASATRSMSGSLDAVITPGEKFRNEMESIKYDMEGGVDATEAARKSLNAFNNLVGSAVTAQMAPGADINSAAGYSTVIGAEFQSTQVADLLRLLNTAIDAMPVKLADALKAAIPGQRGFTAQTYTPGGGH